MCLPFSLLNLAQIPPSVSALVNLHTLSVNGNKITSSSGALPPSITSISLASNGIVNLELFPHLRELTKLKQLSLGNNKISSVPDFLIGLTELETVDFNHNNLAYLPKWFLDSLKKYAQHCARINMVQRKNVESVS